ncbi:MAG: hypothetical protein FWC69_04290 [Defluviitaleaceae bacterium]|nr:hypothetical protein [Defluviitaleaceae bacterium]
MANTSRRKKQDNILRNAIIAFVVVIGVIAALLILNNRNLAFAGTVNGERVPSTYLRFQHMMLEQQLWEQELWWFFDEASIAQMAFDNLVNMFAATQQADALGVSMTQEQIDESRERAAQLRADFTIDGEDFIENMGFSRNGFYAFMERLDLFGLIALEVTGGFEVAGEDMEEAWQQFIEENHLAFLEPIVYLVEFETYEEARMHLDNFMMTGDMHSIILEHSLWPLPHIHEQDEEEGDVVPVPVNIMLFEPTTEEFRMAASMEPGQTTDVIFFENAESYGFFHLVEIVENDIEDSREVFEQNFTDVYASERFREWTDEIVEQADVNRNERLFDEPTPMFDLDVNDDDILGDEEADVYHDNADEEYEEETEE